MGPRDRQSSPAVGRRVVCRERGGARSQRARGRSSGVDAFARRSELDVRAWRRGWEVTCQPYARVAAANSQPRPNASTAALKSHAAGRTREGRNGRRPKFGSAVSRYGSCGTGFVMERAGRWRRLLWRPRRLGAPMPRRHVRLGHPIDGRPGHAPIERAGRPQTPICGTPPLRSSSRWSTARARCTPERTRLDVVRCRDPPQGP